MANTKAIPIKVGTAVFALPGGNYARYGKKIWEGAITRIGRIYFYARFEGRGEEKFSIQDFSSRCEDCNSSLMLFPSLEACQDYLLYKAQKLAVKEFFSRVSVWDKDEIPSQESMNAIYEILLKEGLIKPVQAVTTCT